jgi:DNA-binding beta-propeller fold protein YncE
MKQLSWAALVILFVISTFAWTARAEMLAMVVYETKAEESIRELRVEKTRRTREDGLAIIDVDPASEAYGRILAKFPLPEGLAPHHQYYNRDKTKIYVTGTLLPMLHVVDLTRAPYRVKRIDTPGCERLDTVVFSSDNKTWWVSCIATDKLLIGDAIADRVVGEISIPIGGPHGMALHQGLDRLIVTNLGSFGNFREMVTIVEASTGRVLSSHKMSREPSPSGSGPTDVLFARRRSPPIAYINVAFGGESKKGTLWAGAWSPGKRDFEFQQVFDFGTTESGIPVTIGMDREEERLFVSTTNPGHFHIFDLTGDPMKPKLLKTLRAAQGAHHAALSPDERYAFVQNGVLNLPGLSDGSITVVDLEKLEVVDSIDTFKDAGYAINHILMLPEWHRAGGE